MFRDVYHVAYLTDDVDAAQRFYQNVFGAEVIMESSNPTTGSKMAYLRVGATQVELIEPVDRSRLNGHTGLVIDHIGYVVDSIDSEMVRLAANGIGFASPAPKMSPEGARLIYLDTADTLGARIHITERPPVIEPSQPQL